MFVATNRRQFDANHFHFNASQRQPTPASASANQRQPTPTKPRCVQGSGSTGRSSRLASSRRSPRARRTALCPNRSCRRPGAHLRPAAADPTPLHCRRAGPAVVARQVPTIALKTYESPPPPVLVGWAPRHLPLPFPDLPLPFPDLPLPFLDLPLAFPDLSFNSHPGLSRHFRASWH